MAWSGLKVKGSVPPPVGGHSVVFYENQMFVFGGLNGDAANTEMQILKASGLKSWTLPTKVTGKAPAAVQYVSATLVDKRAFLFGGANAAMTEFFDELSVLDLAKTTWSRPRVTGETPLRRAGHSATLVGTTIYVMGGLFRTNIIACDVVAFDTGKSAWSAVPTSGTPPSPRYRHAAWAVGPHIFVFGGLGAEGPLSDLHVLDTTSMTWSAIATAYVPSPRFDVAALAVGPRCYLFGGRASLSPGDALGEFLAFDADSRAWLAYTAAEIVAGQPGPRASSTLVQAARKQLFLFGGVEPSGASTNELFVLDVAKLDEIAELAGGAIAAPNAGASRPVPATPSAAAAAPVTAAPAPAPEPAPVVVSAPAPAPAVVETPAVTPASDEKSAQAAAVDAQIAALERSLGLAGGATAAPAAAAAAPTTPAPAAPAATQSAAVAPAEDDSALRAKLVAAQGEDAMLEARIKALRKTIQDCEMQRSKAEERAQKAAERMNQTSEATGPQITAADRDNAERLAVEQQQKEQVLEAQAVDMERKAREGQGKAERLTQEIAAREQALKERNTTVQAALAREQSVMEDRQIALDFKKELQARAEKTQGETEAIRVSCAESIKSKKEENERITEELLNFYLTYEAEVTYLNSTIARLDNLSQGTGNVEAIAVGGATQADLDAVKVDCEAETARRLAAEQSKVQAEAKVTDLVKNLAKLKKLEAKAESNLKTFEQRSETLTARRNELKEQLAAAEAKIQQTELDMVTIEGEVEMKDKKELAIRTELSRVQYLLNDLSDKTLACRSERTAAEEMVKEIEAALNTIDVDVRNEGKKVGSTIDSYVSAGATDVESAKQAKAAMTAFKAASGRWDTTIQKFVRDHRSAMAASSSRSSMPPMSTSEEAPKPTATLAVPTPTAAAPSSGGGPPPPPPAPPVAPPPPPAGGVGNAVRNDRAKRLSTNNEVVINKMEEDGYQGMLRAIRKGANLRRVSDMEKQRPKESEGDSLWASLRNEIGSFRNAVRPDSDGENNDDDAWD